MRQVLAVVLVLALFGCALAKIRDDRYMRRPVREAREKLAANIALQKDAKRKVSRLHSLPDVANNARQEALKAYAHSRKQKNQMEVLREKFSSFKPNMENLDQIRDKMIRSRGDDLIGKMPNRFTNEKNFKDRMNKMMKKQMKN